MYVAAALEGETVPEAGLAAREREETQARTRNQRTKHGRDWRIDMADSFIGMQAARIVKREERNVKRGPVTGSVVH